MSPRYVERRRPVATIVHRHHHASVRFMRVIAASHSELSRLLPGEGVVRSRYEVVKRGSPAGEGSSRNSEEPRPLAGVVRLRPLTGSPPTPDREGAERGGDPGSVRPNSRPIGGQGPGGTTPSCQP